jgi:hypothetical protein
MCIVLRRESLVDGTESKRCGRGLVEKKKMAGELGFEPRIF